MSVSSVVRARLSPVTRCTELLLRSLCIWQGLLQRIAAAVASTGSIGGADRIASAPSPAEVSAASAQQASVQV